MHHKFSSKQILNISIFSFFTLFTVIIGNNCYAAGSYSFLASTLRGFYAEVSRCIPHNKIVCERYDFTNKVSSKHTNDCTDNATAIIDWGINKCASGAQYQVNCWDDTAKELYVPTITDGVNGRSNGYYVVCILN